MKKLSFLSAVFVFAICNVYSQVTAKNTEESPLDCAFYLLSINELDHSEIERLADIYFQLGNYEKAVLTINFLDPGNRVGYFNVYSTKLLEAGKVPKAHRFLTEAVKNLDKKDLPDERVLPRLAANLIEVDRLNEAFNLAKDFSGEFETDEISPAIAETLLRRRKTENAREFLNQTYFPHDAKDDLTRAAVALIYAKLNDKERARKILENLEQTAFTGVTDIETENKRRRILFLLIKIHLEIGETDKALELWNHRGDPENFYDFSLIINDLIAYGHQEKALPLLLQMQSMKDQIERCGSDVVKAYLKIDQVDNALYAARNMSEEDDNFCQQSSFIDVADKFLSQGKTNSALEILDLAFQRAKRIKYEELPMASVGADPASRKTIYLGQIFNRLVKIKRFDKARIVLDSIEDKQNKSSLFIEFTKHQTKVLPRRKIHEMLSQAQELVKEEDEYYSINAKLLSVEVYARIGEKDKAVSMIAEALAEAKESCCYENDFLLKAGKVFEENNLKPSDKLKKILRAYVADAE